MSASESVALVCHPATPCSAVRDIAVDVVRSADGILTLTFALTGDLRRVCVPPLQDPRMVIGLWEHTCCEAFIAADGASAYHELNLAPSREWAVFAFSAYRQVAPLDNEAVAPDIEVISHPDRLVLDVRVQLHELSARYAQRALRIGLSAVVEDSDGTRSCWALRHAGTQPDFHHRDAFAMRLEPPGHR